jgi:hypothetical protein
MVGDPFGGFGATSGKGRLRVLSGSNLMVLAVVHN